MDKRKIAVAVSNANQKVNAFETIDAIQKAGFRDVFIQWYNRDWILPQEEQLRYIRGKGLNLDFSGFKDRVFAVHLHDNDKSDDLHQIPFGNY